MKIPFKAHLASLCSVPTAFTVCLSWLLWAIHPPVRVIPDCGSVIDVLAHFPKHAHQENTISRQQSRWSALTSTLCWQMREQRASAPDTSRHSDLKNKFSDPMQTPGWQRQISTDASRGLQPMKSRCPGSKAPPPNRCINRFSWQGNSSPATKTSTLKDSL